MTRTNSLEGAMAACERQCDLHERGHLDAAKIKFNWRASAVRHLFHLLPGENILMLGAGTGEWCDALVRASRSEVRITAASFVAEFTEAVRLRQEACVQPVFVKDLSADLPAESFDYVVGSHMLLHGHFPEALAAVYRLLKPSGQMLFFEKNGLRRFSSTERLIHACSHQGFTHVNLLPYDIVPDFLSPSWIGWLKSKLLMFEHAPITRSLCRILLVAARKPGSRQRLMPNLAHDRRLFNTVSVVVPCHNEAANIPALVARLLELYGPYIHEILIVNDNSSDETVEVALRLHALEARVRLINRSKPNGVGLALRDGYRAASGKYILSMDCDFIDILPEVRELFEAAVVEGRDGAVGSRFSHDSVLIDYPFSKLFFNRSCHAIIRATMRHVRDVTNNLKFYRADILKELDIQSSHFSANLETGLKPVLAGYNIKEVPISWVNRTHEMGSSTFAIRNVGYDYARTLYQIWREYQFRDKTSSILFGLPKRRPGTDRIERGVSET
jgi:SAM-dependent methyltransferase